MADDAVQVQILADITDINEKLEQLSEKFGESAEGMEEHAKGLTGVIETISGQFSDLFEFVGISAAIEGVSRLRETMDGLAEGAEHLKSTAELYQTNTTTLQALNTAAIESGVSTQTMEIGLRHLEMRMQAARDGSAETALKLKEVGITAEDLKNPSFGAAEAMVAVAQSGAETGKLMDALGPKALNVAESFGKVKQGMAAMTEESERQGALTEEQIAVLAEYSDQMKTMELHFTNMKEQLAAYLVPLLETFMDEIRELIGVTATGSDTVNILKTAFANLVLEIGQFLGDIKEVADGVVGAFELIAKGAAGMAALITSPFHDTKAVFHAVMDDLDTTWDATVSKMTQDANIGTEAVEKLKWSLLGLDEIKVEPKKLTPYDDPSRPNMGALEKQLEAQKKIQEDEVASTQKALEQEHQLNTVSNEQFLDADIALISERYAIQEEYYHKLSALPNQTKAKQDQYAAEVVDLEVRKNEEIMAQQTKFSEEELKIADSSIKAQEKLSEGQIQESQKVLDAQLALHKISNQQYLAADEVLINARFAAEISAQQQLASLPNQTAEAVRQANATILVLEQQKNAAILAAEEKTTQQMNAEWQAVLKPMESAWSTSINGFVSGTMTLQKAFKEAMDNMVKSIFESSINTMINNWITGQNQMTAATQVWAHLTTALHAQAATQTKAIDVQTGQETIQTNAAVAGSGAAAALSLIPFVGPALAIVGMAAMEAAVMALIGKIASAEGGMMVDRDQLAMVHEDEMILPSHITQGINERILGNDSFGNSGKGSGGDTYHFGVNALDPGSFHEMIKNPRYRDSIMKEIKRGVSRNPSMRSPG